MKLGSLDRRLLAGLLQRPLQLPSQPPLVQALLVEIEHEPFQTDPRQPVRHSFDGSPLLDPGGQFSEQSEAPPFHDRWRDRWLPVVAIAATKSHRSRHRS
jgi:hypothetical protein